MMSAATPVRILILGNVIYGLAAMGVMAYFPLFFQVSLGESPTRAGLIIASTTVFVTVGSYIAGRLTTGTGHYLGILRVAPALSAVSLALFLLIDRGDSALAAIPLLALMGLSMGMAFPTMTTATQNSLALPDLGAGTAAINFFRTLGQTLGVGGLGGEHLAPGVDGHPGVSQLGLPDACDLPESVDPVIALHHGGFAGQHAHDRVPVAFVGGQAAQLVEGVGVVGLELQGGAQLSAGGLLVAYIQPGLCGTAAVAGGRGGIGCAGRQLVEVADGQFGLASCTGDAGEGFEHLGVGGVGLVEPLVLLPGLVAARELLGQDPTLAGSQLCQHRCIADGGGLLGDGVENAVPVTGFDLDSLQADQRPQADGASLFGVAGQRGQPLSCRLEAACIDEGAGELARPQLSSLVEEGDDAVDVAASDEQSTQTIEGAAACRGIA